MIAKLARILALFLIVAPAYAEETRIAADVAHIRAQTGQLTIIDIRSPDEWRKTGIPAGAMAVTMHRPEGKAGFAKTILQAVKGDKNRPIAVICAVGSRSRWAQAFLATQGHTRVYDITEGMLGRGKGLPGWIRRGLPVSPCPRC